MARICVPVCVRDCAEIRDAIEAAARAADIVELRVDCLSEVTAETLKASLPPSSGQPFIITFRSPQEGGRSEIVFKMRKKFWLSLKDLPANIFVDLELELVEAFASNNSTDDFSIKWENVICSHHDFEKVPDNIEQQ